MKNIKTYIVLLLALLFNSCGLEPKKNFTSLVTSISYRYLSNVEFNEFNNLGYKILIPKLGEFGTPEFTQKVNSKNFILFVEIAGNGFSCINITDQLANIESNLKKEGYQFKSFADMLTFYFFELPAEKALEIDKGYQIRDFSKWILASKKRLLPVLSSNGINCFLLNDDRSYFSELLYLDDVSKNYFHFKMRNLKENKSLDFDAMRKEREEILLNTKINRHP